MVQHHPATRRVEVDVVGLPLEQTEGLASALSDAAQAYMTATEVVPPFGAQLVVRDHAIVGATLAGDAPS